MDEQELKNKKKIPEWDLNKYIAIAVIAFVTICSCMLFFFFIYRYHGLTAYWQKLVAVLQPIIMGCITAYLLNPVMMFLETHLLVFLQPRMKSEKKAKKTARSIATGGALVFFLLIIFVLLDILIPELITSIQGMAASLPAEVNSFIAWSRKTLSGDSKLAEMLGSGLVTFTNYMEQWLQMDVMPQINSYIASITTGVISLVKTLFNFVIGLVIAIYLLTSKETFIGQGKKIVYAVLPPKVGNHVIKTLRITHSMFGGFISGKILDSAIIGVIAYVGLLLMKMPYSLLVAVIVGVTNIVPFFGPFIGAVPGVILIALAEPIKGLYFLIFVFVLQQVDGNIIGPKILGDSTGLSSFWVVFAILVGGGLFGFMGMLLGVPTFAVIYYLIREIVAYVLRRRRLPEDTVDYIRMKDIDMNTGKVRYDKKE
ncbi:MAG: AI-2E family transporter [Eubacterium sp.]|nr:AI-2E family transporter [Eubacterium sp.]